MTDEDNDDGKLPVIPNVQFQQSFVPFGLFACHVSEYFCLHLWLASNNLVFHFYSFHGVKSQIYLSWGLYLMVRGEEVVTLLVHEVLNVWHLVCRLSQLLKFVSYVFWFVSTKFSYVYQSSPGCSKVSLIFPTIVSVSLGMLVNVQMKCGWIPSGGGL